MSVSVSQRHCDLGAQSPSQRAEIVELFIRDAATLRSILLRSVHSRYHLATTNALLRRLCYLDIVNVGASTALPRRSCRSGQPEAWFKCSPKVGVALLDSRAHYR